MGTALWHHTRICSQTASARMPGGSCHRPGAYREAGESVTGGWDALQPSCACMGAPNSAECQYFVDNSEGDARWLQCCRCPGARPTISRAIAHRTRVCKDLAAEVGAITERALDVRRIIPHVINTQPVMIGSTLPPDYRAILAEADVSSFEQTMRGYGGLWCCNRPPGGRGAGHIWCAPVDPYQSSLLHPLHLAYPSTAVVS